MKMNDEVIKNCPFCGSDEVYVIDGKTLSRTLCNKCGAEGPQAFTRKGAIYKWNIRVNSEGVEDGTK